MADRAVAEARQTYLVEQYRPGLTVDGLKQWAARVREAAGELEREGKSVRYLRSTIVPADESLLCVLEAAGEELVREAYARAGLQFERLSVALPDVVERPGPTSEPKGVRVEQQDENRSPDRVRRCGDRRRGRNDRDGRCRE